MDKLIHIFQVDAAEADKIAARPDQPHLHDFEELLIGLEGSLEHFIDFGSEKFQAPYVSFVTKGKVHRLVPRAENGKCLVWGIRFRSELVGELTFHLYSLFHNSANLQLQAGKGVDRFVNMCELMQEELAQKEPDYCIIKHLMNALFLMIENLMGSQPKDQSSQSQSTTFTNFLQILEENFRRPEGVEFYAEKLFMTSRNLNLICKKILQQSVSEIIETRKLTEAKNLLTATDKTISEIAFELGYKEKSYFSNVFKKKSGQTPTEFREEMRSLV